MKKEEFISLGISEELAAKAEAASLKELEGYVTKEQLDTANAENKTLAAQVKERDSQIEGLKKSAGDNAELQKQIETLQADNKAKDEAHAEELIRLKIDAAVDKALAAGGAKNVKAVKALLDLTDAKLSDDGTVKGLSEQIQKLQAGEDSKFLFAEKQQTQNQQQLTGFQPGASTTVPNSKQAGYETRLAEARKNNNQLEVIKIKREAFEDGGLVLM